MTKKTPASAAPPSTDHVVWFENLTNNDVGIAGGKNASLGELIRELKAQKIAVPDGFAVTAHAYRAYVDHNNLSDPIRERLAQIADHAANPTDTSRTIRALFMDATFPPDLEQAILDAYNELNRRFDTEHCDVAVRSSATAEDLPDASFAGQQETFLHITGASELLHTCKRCFASLFTERAISYREQKGFDHMAVALSIGVQKMVRSDKGASGVMFTLDTENGFPDVVVINAAYGLGETVVQGAVTPDEYRVYKPLLEDPDKAPIIEKSLGEKQIQMIYGEAWTSRVRTVNTRLEDRLRFALENDDILKLARWAAAIEKHYARPMDIEWALDGDTKELFIVQARPETVQSQQVASSFKSARLLAEDPDLILQGIAVGNTIAAGTVCPLKTIADAAKFKEGQILVAEQTDPDWVPIMKIASGIITNHGGRTSHAAIVSRELGVPAVIGTGDATHMLFSGEEITLSCAEGDKGHVYRGILPFEESEIDLTNLPETKTDVMLNIASPEAAFRWWRLPAAGIGLARLEFVINNVIKIHPMALATFKDLDDDTLRIQVSKMTAHYPDPPTYFVDNLAMGIAQIAASRYPKPVIVRTSDFKTNEYSKLFGGKNFEPEEENPMIGFRGASRYYSPEYRPAFDLECQALKKAREEIGLDNIIIMIPFCRTLEEADRVLEVMKDNGLERGKNGLQIYVMAEIPSNIILASQFAQRFDGFSIGSNDLTQLVLGVDRDSDRLADVFDERNEAITTMIAQLIETAHTVGRKVGLCGQAPSDHPEFAELLVDLGIDSISLNPDSVIETTKHIAATEAKKTDT